MRSNGGRGRDVLYRQEALERASRIHHVSYELVLDLAESRETYSGRAVIEFRLEPGAGPLFLDFTGTLGSLRVNGTDLAADHRDHRIWIAPEHLRMHNRIVIEYLNSYDATGDGFHAFLDPQDGATYLYSNLEPFSAHRIFPCFDQPDIKATYRLLVTAPEGWHVVSAEAPIQTTYMARGRRMHEFARSATFSTYLFALIAGPYVRLEASHDGVPLGLYGRGSMRAELERSADEIFEITRQGLDYYADLFGRRYPFGKYDQLFVPEFNAGAMENVGAVTFNDSFLFRDPPTYGQRLTRGEVILHELAHMWFGNLVTMRWWDDLWLNETFATYLSFRCLAGASRFRDAWHAFSGQMRPAAYAQDQRVTTHPVATRVEHTDQAVGNFDAITYEKGAAVIKQLVAAVGDDAFRRGLQAYIERHAWGNATLADFLGAIGEAAGWSLDEWARVWLQSPSLNTISARWSAAGGVIESFELHQSAPPGHPTLRPHATTIGLVSSSPEGETLRVAAIPARIDAERARVPEAEGLPVPLFVYPNHGDHDYALAELDPQSLAFVLERLPELPDALLRQQVWSTLWEMVRSADLRSSDYLEAVRRFAPGEVDPSLLQSIVDRAIVAQRRFVPEAQREAAATALMGAALQALEAARDGDLRLVWARTAAAAAASVGDVSQLLDLVDGRSSIDGFTPDQQLRWTLAVKAVAYGVADAPERLARERDRDPSDRGQRALLRAKVSAPDGAVKQDAWDRINGEGYGSDYLTRAAISGFQWAHQRELLLPFRAPFYESVVWVYATRDHAFAASYLRSLAPDRWAEASELERMRSVIEALTDDQGLLRRHLLEVADDLERDIRVQAYASHAEALVG
jgi:aminopeptidase N